VIVAVVFLAVVIGEPVFTDALVDVLLDVLTGLVELDFTLAVHLPVIEGTALTPVLIGTRFSPQSAAFATKTFWFT